ncbi:MAG: DUF58 domain-containing protein [Butyrivibrio sp.]|nr:DUF58 domain-containing protein [Butyrivibrio sp.]
MKVNIYKKNLFIYLALLVGVIVLASFYGGPVSFVPLYALLLLIPVSVLYIFINYRLMSLYQEIEVHKVSKGENHNFRALIDNSGFLPIHKMALTTYHDRCDLYDIQNGSLISLDCRDKTELSSRISCRYAGAYNIGIEKISFSDPFNIFSVDIDVPYSFRAIVRPRITDIANKALDLENLINSTGLKSSRQLDEITGSDMRTYQIGDSLSSINWKVSAKLSELYVRLPDPMEKRHVTILMDASNIPEIDWDTEFLKKRDYFLEFAVSAAYHFGNQGVPVEIIYPSGDIKHSIVDSYDTFLEFYNVVADGIFYSSESVKKQLQSLIQEKRDSYGTDTWIILREDCTSKSDFCSIIG